MKQITVNDFWQKFDLLVGVTGRYNLPEDTIMEEAVATHGLEKMSALIDYLLTDQSNSKPTVNNPSGLIVSTIKGNSSFPKIHKPRAKHREQPNWMKQSLEDIAQFRYYVVHDSNGVRQKDLTYTDINSLWESGSANTDSELMDQFWVVYGCLQLLRNPSMFGEYPAPELSVCRSFPIFEELKSFFKEKIPVSEEDIKQIQAYVEKHKEGRKRFESRQPGLIRVSGIVNEGAD